MRPRPARVALGAALLSLAGPAVGGEWVVDTEGSRVVVHVFRAGLLRAFAHDHHLVPERWRGRATLDPERIEAVEGEVVVDAASLRDGQRSLSAEDRAEVERQVAEEVLDAARFPEVRFHLTGFEPSREPSRAGSSRGILRGRLTLRGVERPLTVPGEVDRGADRIAVRGRTEISRKDFGVEVPSVALGAVTVEDRVEIEFSLLLVPAGD